MLHSPPRPLLDVSALAAGYRRMQVLWGVDLAVAAHESVVLLGANGSGKTSLLSTLTGYMPPTAGHIAVLGETYGRSDWRDLRKRVGLVSSSVHQMMAGHESALDAIISGRILRLLN